MTDPIQPLILSLNSIHQPGRSRCFELGNPFYYQDAADKSEPGNEKGDYYRKELPSGEIYLVTIQIVFEHGNYSIKDSLIRQIK